MIVGSEVVAEVRIEEDEQVIAEPGEIGRIVEVFPEVFLTVLVAFEGGLVECCADEITPLEAGAVQDVPGEVRPG
jgi:hypothetical protein